MIIIVLCSYALFDMDGNQVPQELVREIGVAFEKILEEASIVLLFCFVYLWDSNYAWCITFYFYTSVNLHFFL